MKTHAPQGNRYHAPTHGGCRAAPRPAARAQRRHRARGKAQRAAAGRAQCRCTKNRDQRGGSAAPEGRNWPPTAPTCSCPRGLSCCSTPRCSCPATPPRAGKKIQGAAVSRAQCRCTKRGRQSPTPPPSPLPFASDLVTRCLLLPLTSPISSPEESASS